MLNRVLLRLRALAGFAVLAAMSQAAHSTVLPPPPQVDVVVTPVKDSVSLSVPPSKVAYSIYNVTVTNLGQTSVSGFHFFGYAIAQSLPATSPVATATFSSSTGVDCSQGIFVSFTFRCSVGTLGTTPEDKTKTFTVTFQTPATGNSLKLGWAGDVNILPPYSDQGAAVVALTADASDQFTSGVPVGGGLFYTGVNGGSTSNPGGVALRSDWTTTSVFVPDIDFSTTITILETTLPQSCSPNYLSNGGCFDISVSVPGSFDYLTIYLRIDSSRLSAFSNLNNAVFYYTPTGGTVFNPIGACGARVGPSNLPLPQPGQPCIESRTKFTATTAPLPDWKGDWQIKILALDNGRFKN